MYQTSDRYKQKVYEPSTRHLLNIYINDKKIDDRYILEFKTSQQLFSGDEFTLGSVTSKAVELKLYKTAAPDKINRVYIESGIDGEIVPIGYFNVDDISRDDDFTVNLKLLDDMIKFEQNYDGSKLNYPVTIKEVLEDICLKAGVELRHAFFFKYEQENSCL